MNVIDQVVAIWRYATCPRLRLRFVDDEPTRVSAGVLYIVGTRALPKWAIFACPCGCEDRVELYLGPYSSPRWSASFGRRGTTLRPSVWRTGGCGAHFLVRNGRVDFV